MALVVPRTKSVLRVMVLVRKSVIPAMVAVTELAVKLVIVPVVTFRRVMVELTTVKLVIFALTAVNEDVTVKVETTKGELIFAVDILRFVIVALVIMARVMVQVEQVNCLIVPVSTLIA